MKKVVFTSVISLFLLLPITSYALTVKVLVVGGGGGGGAGRSAGGGGAGGCQYDANHDVSIQSYSVIVGIGGVGGVKTISAGTDGNNSVFDNVTVIGGGGGGNGNDGVIRKNGNNGGSGGGSGENSTGGTGTVSQGNNGGNGVTEPSPNDNGGGGGGASQVGYNGTSLTGGGGGGNGTANSITGLLVTYAGGGGGGSDSGDGTVSAGGSGGGGNGGNYNGVADIHPQNGTDGLGGGGGGGGLNNSPSFPNGGNGGSGVVIISLVTADFAGYTITGGVKTTDGANSVYTFDSSGTFAISANSPSPVTTILTATSTTAVYGGTVDLSATLATSTSGGGASASGVSGKDVGFTWNGASIGTSTTGTNGVATFSGVSLTSNGTTTGSRLSAGLHAGLVGAIFVGDGSTYVTSTSSADVTVSPKPLTVTASTTSKVYDATTTATTTLSDNKVSGDDVTDHYVSASFADTHVGSGKVVTVSGLSITGSSAGNYTLATTTATSTANITPVSITVTADDKSITVGDSDPTFTLGYSGFVHSEGTSTLSVLPTATVVGTHTVVGTYPIVPTGAVATNYIFTYQNGTLTVNAAPTVPSTPVATTTATVSSASSGGGNGPVVIASVNAHPSSVAFVAHQSQTSVALAPVSSDIKNTGAFVVSAPVLGAKKKPIATSTAPTSQTANVVSALPQTSAGKWLNKSVSVLKTIFKFVFWQFQSR